MRRPPRPPEQPLFSSSYIAWSLTQGAIALAFVAGLFVLALQEGLPEADARTLTFAALVAANLGLVLVNRSQGASLWAGLRRRNVALWLVVGVTVALLAIIIAFEPTRELFHFGPLHVDDAAVAAATGASLLLFLNIAKRLFSLEKASVGQQQGA